MSAITCHPLSSPASRTFGMRSFVGLGRRAFTVIRAWRNCMHQRRELLMLNDVELSDLSLTEADANREASKPFWESISLTGR